MKKLIFAFFLFLLASFGFSQNQIWAPLPTGFTLSAGSVATPDGLSARARVDSTFLLGGSFNGAPVAASYLVEWNPKANTIALPFGLTDQPNDDVNVVLKLGQDSFLIAGEFTMVGNMPTPDRVAILTPNGFSLPPSLNGNYLGGNQNYGIQLFSAEKDADTVYITGTVNVYDGVTNTPIVSTNMVRLHPINGWEPVPFQLGRSGQFRSFASHLADSLLVCVDATQPAFVRRYNLRQKTWLDSAGMGFMSNPATDCYAMGQWGDTVLIGGFAFNTTSGIWGSPLVGYVVSRDTIIDLNPNPNLQNSVIDLILAIEHSSSGKTYIIAAVSNGWKVFELNRSTLAFTQIGNFFNSFGRGVVEFDNNLYLHGLVNWTDDPCSGTYPINIAILADTFCQPLGFQVPPQPPQFEVEVSKVQVFPNPTSGALNIRTPEVWSDTLHVAISSIEGRIVSEYWLGGHINHLHLANLPMGMYILRLSDGARNTHLQRVVKQ